MELIIEFSCCYQRFRHFISDFGHFISDRHFGTSSRSTDFVSVVVSLSHRWNSPLTKQGTPLKHKNAPLTKQGTPPKHKNAPLTKQGTPPKHKNAPLTKQGTPPKHKNASLTNQGAPRKPEFPPLCFCAKNIFNLSFLPKRHIFLIRHQISLK
ncbi:hypothetical protein [Lysinibacillus sphaericus]|uniref:hypothetical protein n=1 Tax=Lysinibacillus sphaericus TaxID=1421 RepID=UPI001CBBA9F3|nr:hypothetical protein [Lysinibacillus sphaericus]